MVEDYVLSVENLRKSYAGPSGGRILAVNDISLAIRAGEILALLGPNGAGKTTTVKMLSGLLLPSTGVIRINGHDPFQSREALRHIGSVLEGNRNLYWRMTSYENLLYFGILKGMKYRDAKARASSLLEKFSLADKRKVQVRFLSRGMQQRLAIAVSMIHRPMLLLLDEPALGLDAQSTIEVKAMIKELVAGGVGVLLTTHQLDIVEELADRIGIIDKGVVVSEQNTQDLLQQYANDIYEVHLLTDPTDRHMERLRGLPYEIELHDRCLVVSCSPSRLYEVMSELKPLQIHQIKRHKSDLNSIFLRLTGAPVAEVQRA